MPAETSPPVSRIRVTDGQDFVEAEGSAAFMATAIATFRSLKAMQAVQRLDRQHRIAHAVAILRDEAPRSLVGRLR